MASAFPPLRAAVLMLALSSLMPTAAQACSVFADSEQAPAQKRRDARLLVDRAAAIIDGEVVRPFLRGRQSAIVRAFRILKGPQQTYFEVGERDSCDWSFEQVGQRMRIVLFGGPDLYFASYLGVEDRYVDRLLRSDRRRDWPYRAGVRLPAE